MAGGWFLAALTGDGQRLVEERGLRDRRRELLAGLEGDVLELGAGDGPNLAHFARGVRLVLVEPDARSRRRLSEAVARSGREASVVDALGEALPFRDACFDAVVTTLVLCSVNDAERTLAEIRRVLRPSGRLVLIEHVRGDGARGRLQDALAPVSRLLRLCSPNRRTGEAVRSAGFELAEQRFVFDGAPPWERPGIAGVAVRRP